MSSGTAPIYDLKERFAVMRTQDETAYRCEDYLSPEFQQRLQKHAAHTGRSSDSLPSLSSSGSSSTSSGSGLDVEWREKIIDWCYQVVDHFEFSREIVGVALSYLDRFLSKKAAVINKRTFQLAAMTCLQLAVKLYEQRRLPMSHLVELSRGFFTAQHVVAMERSILNTLAYQVHPPTAMCFLRHLFLLLPGNCCAPKVRHDTEEVAKFVLELGVFEYDLVPRKKSSVALAAALNSLDRVDEFRLSRRSRTRFLDNIRQCAGLDTECDEVKECREKLRALFSPYEQETNATAQESRDEETDEGRDATVSPVSVAAFAAATAEHQHVVNCPPN